MAVINERKMKVAEDSILSADAVRAYLENRLSDEERVAFEQIVAADFFVSDALDGIRSKGNLNAAFGEIESIANDLREQSGISKKTTDTLANAFQMNWSVLAYAAVVIAVIVVVGFVIAHQSSKQNKTPVAVEETVVPPVAVDSPTILAKDAVKPDSMESSAVTIVHNSAENVSSALSAPQSVPAKPVVKSVTDTVSAMTLFNNGNYIEAEKKFDQMIASNPDNYEGRYFGAVSAYINGNSSKAEKQFDYMLSKGIYPEGSKWYKANILLKNGDTATAKEMLRSLSISAGIYKERAIKKLEGL